MPLARQQQEFERYSVAISRQTMSNWVLRCSDFSWNVQRVSSYGRL
ncbi:MAG: IS66 family transposase [Acetobacterium sp.]